MEVVRVPGRVGVTRARVRHATVILVDEALPARAVRDLARLVCTSEECARLEWALRPGGRPPSAPGRRA